MVALGWKGTVGQEAKAVQCGRQEETAVKERKPSWQHSGTGGEEVQGGRERQMKGEEGEDSGGN